MHQNQPIRIDFIRYTCGFFAMRKIMSSNSTIMSTTRKNYSRHHARHTSFPLLFWFHLMQKHTSDFPLWKTKMHESAIGKMYWKNFHSIFEFSIILRSVKTHFWSNNFSKISLHKNKFPFILEWVVAINFQTNNLFCSIFHYN